MGAGVEIEREAFVGEMVGRESVRCRTGACTDSKLELLLALTGKSRKEGVVIEGGCIFMIGELALSKLTLLMGRVAAASSP